MRGACAQKECKSIDCRTAWAWGSGCVAQGVTTAVTVAPGAADGDVDGAAAPASATRACASSRASGPLTPAVKASGKVAVLPGTEVSTVPCRPASTFIAPLAPTEARPRYRPEPTVSEMIRNSWRLPENR